MSEKEVHLFLSKNLHLLGPGSLELEGTEYQVASGRIDILAKDGLGAFVVIELKSGTATRDAIGQIQGYIGDLMQSHPGRSTRGILVATGLDQGARSALRASPHIDFWAYELRFAFFKQEVTYVSGSPSVKPPAIRSHEDDDFLVTRVPSRETTTTIVEDRYCVYCHGQKLATVSENGSAKCRGCGNYL